MQLVVAAGNDAVRPVQSIVLTSKSANLNEAIFYTKKREIKMQWKYVVLQYLVLGPGLEPQVLNIAGWMSRILF